MIVQDMDPATLDRRFADYVALCLTGEEAETLGPVISRSLEAIQA